MLLTPVTKTERVQLLDVLRGVAILGIFIMNMEAFSLYWTLNDAEKSGVPLGQYSHSVEFLLTMFIEGKFYSIFSLLFGIGFAIYLKKAEGNPAVLKLFKRRLLILLIIGFIHLLVWTGDIVAFYALIGFILIPFRKFNNKTLLIIAGLCILSPIGWYALKMSNPEYFDLSRYMFMAGEHYAGKIGVRSLSELRAALMENDPVYFIKVNIAGIFFRYGDLTFQSRLFKVLGMFILGLVIGRTELYNKVGSYKRLLWIIILTGLVIGLPANFFLAKYKGMPGYSELTMHGLKQTIAYAFGVAPLALSYVAILTLIFNGSGKKILTAIAPAGKMALSNYLFQTAVGTVLFTGFGFAFSPIGPAGWIIVAVIVFLFQILISHLWLKSFHFGPVEWLWRSATYGRLQKFRRKPESF